MGLGDHPYPRAKSDKHYGVTRSNPVRAEVPVNTIVGDSDNNPLEITLNWTTGLKK